MDRPLTVLAAAAALVFPGVAAAAPVPASVAAAPVVPRLDGPVAARIADLRAQGRRLGARPGVFAKAGDSITESASFLQDIGCGAGSLGAHRALAPTIAYFRRTRFDPGLTSAWCEVANSFTRASAAAVAGWDAGAALAPARGLPGCPGAVAPIDCELRRLRPATVLIEFGTNDLERFGDRRRFRGDLGAIVRRVAARGAVPVLFTIPPRRDRAVFAARVGSYNAEIVALGARERIPVANYWRALALGGVPGDGLDADGIHPSLCGTSAADFTPAGLRCGYNVRNLVALEALAALRRR
ncbi:MAG: SGNH/GDSL hydrolase family protein [Solirubrobacteraceae bacterium]